MFIPSRVRRFSIHLDFSAGLITSISPPFEVQPANCFDFAIPVDVHVCDQTDIESDRPSLKKLRSIQPELLVEPTFSMQQAAASPVGMSPAAAPPLFGLFFVGQSYPLYSNMGFQQVDAQRWVLDVCTTVGPSYWDLKEVRLHGGSCDF